MKLLKKCSLVLAGVSAIAGLTACGNLTGNKANNTGKTEDGKTSILMYQIGQPPKNIDKLMENANKIIGEKLDAKLNIQYIDWGDYEEKMSIITSSGENYDIAFANNYVLNAGKGAYADLTDLYKKEGKALYDVLDPAYIKGNTINGKIYAVPVQGNVASQQMLSFNMNLVKKHNLDISGVKTYKDLEPLLKVIKEKEPEVTPIAWTKFSLPHMNFALPGKSDLPLVVNLDGDTTKIVNPYEVEGYVEHLKTFHDFYKKGYIAADVATSDVAYDLATQNWFVREETQGPADFGDSLLSTVAGYEIQSVPITTAYKTNDTTQVANFVISQTSKNKEKAMEVLTLLNTNKELLNGLVFGPEGENWEKDPKDDNRIKLLDGYAADTRMSAWNTGNSQILYVTDKVTDADVAQAEKVLAEAVEAPTLGFNFNIDPVKTEVTSVQNIIKQYAPGINSGTVDPEQGIKELMDKLNSEGSYTKVKAEMQRQYDEFLAKKN
ncbi:MULTISPECIES: ABC transporter substrate-binding protein [Streptococcus]|uniref:ABC transporter substrate-binding protein n=1 Tax=Streptococcus caledonicus TaxID=2614158 RepID=A0ABW0UCV4_9STRE|nr:ABC transporter substrate-binding protein [Streptococcus sp. S784/96/1]